MLRDDFVHTFAHIAAQRLVAASELRDPVFKFGF